MSTANSILTKIESANEKINKVREEIKTDLEKDITEVFNSMFSEYPEFLGFRFHAYTPYFNDGDPCVFGYYGYEFSIKDSFITNEQKKELYSYDEKFEYDDDDDDDSNVENSIWYDGPWRVPEGSEGTRFGSFVAEVIEINNILEEAEDFIQIIWGDHIEVIFTRNGIIVNGYDHD